MAIGLMGCVGADEIPKRQYGGSGGDGGSLPGLPGGKGGYGGGYYNHHSMSRQREYDNHLYWYCLGLVRGSAKRKWRDYMSYDDNMQNYYHPLHCKRFSKSPRIFLKRAKKSHGRHGASYYGGIGGQGGIAGSGPGGGSGGHGGAGIYGGSGGKGGKGGNAY